MNIKDLLQRWEQSGSGNIVCHEYTARLPVHDAARISALVEMYPLKSESEIIAELLSVALDEVEATYPYVQGNRVIAEDDMGDPIYEDIGQTPRFLTLAKKHAGLLAKSNSGDD
jgi:hypothetical protein